MTGWVGLSRPLCLSILAIAKGEQIKSDPVQGSSAAAGYIIRDQNGKMISAKSVNLGKSTITTAEATGLKEGLVAAIDMGIKNLIIEGDNIMVINAVNNRWKAPWFLENLIEDIKRLLSQFKNQVTHHIYREANQAADWIAKVGHLITDKFTIEDSRYSRLNEIICNDSSGFYFPRMRS